MITIAGIGTIVLLNALPLIPLLKILINKKYNINE